MSQPSSTTNPRNLLVADPDPIFLAQLRAPADAPAGTNRAAVQVFLGGREAQRALADPQQRFAAVFINPAIRDPSGISVIRASHQHRPGTPIFLLVDKGAAYGPEDLKGLGIHKVLLKPVTLESLRDAAFPTVSFDAGEAVAASRGEAADVLDAEVSEDDSHFVPIRAENFLSGTRCLFDIYIRLAAGRYLKILHAGDSFAPARVAGYIQKGAVNLYLRKSLQEHYLAYCDRIAGALAGSASAPAKVALAQSLHQGEETIKFLRDRGLSESTLEYAAKYVSNVRKLADRIAPGAPQVLRDFLADIRGYDHGAGTTVIASLLVKELGIESDGSVEITGLAALLHDLGLMRMPIEVQQEDSDKIPHHLRDLYRTHPIKAADVLRDIPRIHPTVIQAVLQHHERRNKTGFPNKTHGTGINHVAEVIGIADEFARLMERIPAERFSDLLGRLELDVFPGFSQPVVDAFRKVFLGAPPSNAGGNSNPKT